MDCTDARELLLEAAEERRPLTGPALDHVGSSEACEAEYAALKRAVDAVRDALPVLAPQVQYLTAERLARLMDAHARHTRIFRLVTYRQFVAAAAVVAIVVSTAFIAWNLGQARSAAGLDEPPAVLAGLAGARLPDPYMPVVAATAAVGDLVTLVGSLPASVSAEPATQRRADSMIQLVHTDSIGISVPVDHFLYDPEESSRWW